MSEKTFKVPVSLIFKGNVIVKSKSRIDARRIVLDKFWALLDMCGDNQDDKIIDWDINKNLDSIKFERIILKD